jgi:hypothetical protein
MNELQRCYKFYFELKIKKEEAYVSQFNTIWSSTYLSTTMINTYTKEQGVHCTVFRRRQECSFVSYSQIKALTEKMIIVFGQTKYWIIIFY